MLTDYTVHLLISQLSLRQWAWFLQQTLQESSLRLLPPGCTAGWAQLSAGSPHLPQRQGLCLLEIILTLSAVNPFLIQYRD